MIRIVKIVLAALLLGGTFGTAHAQTAPWTVSEVSGRVTLKSDKGTEAVSRGEAVHPGAVLETGPGARAVIAMAAFFLLEGTAVPFLVNGVTPPAGYATPEARLYRPSRAPRVAVRK